MKYINRYKLCSIILIIILIFSFAASYAQNVHRDLSRSVVRLHIIANSDTECDQELKLAVRDRLLERFGELFSECPDAGAALQTANANLDLIESVAADEISRRGFGYSVSAETGKFPFPTKVYGDVRLPSGSYNAVRVKIGNAAGHNWWCVMYPNMCFSDTMYEVINEDAKSSLKRVLSEDEYQQVLASGNYQVRFRGIEILKELYDEK